MLQPRLFDVPDLPGPPNPSRWEGFPTPQEHEPFRPHEIARLNGSMVVRAPLNVLPQIMSEGLKSQHETGTSRGTYNPPFRAQVEEKLGLGERPVYGYMQADQGDRGPSHYGNAMIHLNPEVAKRTTVTRGDSLGVHDPGSAIPLPEARRRAERGELAPRHEDDAYTEMQVREGVSPSDISRIDIDTDRPNIYDVSHENLMDIGKRHGIEVRPVTWRSMMQGKLFQKFEGLALEGGGHYRNWNDSTLSHGWGSTAIPSKGSFAFSDDVGRYERANLNTVAPEPLPEADTVKLRGKIDWAKKGIL